MHNVKSASGGEVALDGGMKAWREGGLPLRTL
jgi:rhodanese-related sulfurtransferase